MLNIVLVEPEIPQNCGNIARTCAATRSRLHLIRPLGFDISEKAVKRAGLDYWDMVDIRVYDDLDDFFSQNPNIDLWLATTKAPRDYTQAQFRDGCYLFFGKETAGLPAHLRQTYYERCIRIPMREDARSLNLANSVAVLTYEALRQLDFPNLSGVGEMAKNCSSTTYVLNERSLNMNYNKKTVKDVDVKGKKVLLRCDFNVPMAKDGSGVITDDKRIRAALPTIQYLLEQGAAVIACSHMGKPQPSFDKWVQKQTEKGKDPATLTEEKWKKSLAELTLAPVAARLGELLGKNVALAADVAGPDAQAKAAALQPGEIMLLENTRFEKGETKNDPKLAKAMADMAEIYVSDAFGAVHRAHASTAGVAEFLPAVSGFLIQKELDFIGGALAAPKRPLVAILGGSKVSSKIGVINNLLEIADTVIIGGGMAYTFSAAQGGKIGNSLFEADWQDYANEMVKKAADKGVKLLLPVDTVCGDKFSPDANTLTVDAGQIPDGWEGMDIGPKTIQLYCDAVKDAGTVIWNGPMGVFEFASFAKGTEAVAEALSKTDAITIIGGGDSAAAVQQLGYADKMTHISTGGGASLEFMEGKELPGVACLLDA